MPPEEIGRLVLDIWNKRVASVRATFAHVRTVVLMKGPGLLESVVFETETVYYDSSQYLWSWNTSNNLVGHRGGDLRFTWQPHGAQFTITEPVPANAHKIRIAPPTEIERLTREQILEQLGYTDDWVTLSR